MLGHLFTSWSGSHYLYHSATNRLFRIGDRDRGQLQTNGSHILIKGQLDPAPSIRALREAGLAGDDRPAGMSPITCERSFRNRASNELDLFVLELTQRCNLRCKYCVYSGGFGNRRSHGRTDMELDLALRALKYGFERCKDAPRLGIGFYGGEPFLRFDLMKEVIQTARELAEDRDVSFNVTTNGTLMGPEVCDYCIQGRLAVTLSLDGPQEIHDCFRNDAAGKGSFDRVIGVCEYI